MEDLRTLAAVVQRDDWMIKIDLKNAYLHVPFHPTHRKFLQIQAGKEVFQFRALPFGLNVAPQVFIRILKAALLSLRKKGFRFVAYLDDICLLAPSKETAQQQGTEMVRHLEDMGFVINTKKTCLEPMQKREFLGLEVDTTSLSLSVPDKKMSKIRREVKSIINRSAWPLKKLAATIGLLNSVSRAMRTGHLMTRFLYADVRAALNINPVWNNRLVSISTDAKEELQWWLTTAATFSGRPIHPPVSTMEMWTDASATGWGAVCMEQVRSGIWTEAEANLTFNCRELRRY